MNINIGGILRTGCESTYFLKSNKHNGQFIKNLTISLEKQTPPEVISLFMQSSIVCSWFVSIARVKHKYLFAIENVLANCQYAHIFFMHSIIVYCTVVFLHPELLFHMSHSVVPSSWQNTYLQCPCNITFGAESFVFHFVIQKFKD